MKLIAIVQYTCEYVCMCNCKPLQNRLGGRLTQVEKVEKSKEKEKKEKKKEKRKVVGLWGHDFGGH